MKVLITGITGFAGSHLAEYLLAHHKEVEIYGTRRWRSPMTNLDPDVARKIHFHECDLRDSSNVLQLLDTIRPDRIVHLAAQSFVQTSWTAPNETLTSNVIGQLNILEAVKKLGIRPRIQIAGSSEEYGLVHENELPIKETNPLRPLSPYAVSKVAQDLLGIQYFYSYKIPVIVTRGFNHTGPRRGEVFAESSFAKQIAAAEIGLHPPVIEVGNLSAKRDYTDVRDMVRAYWLALEHGEAGQTYNISSGKIYSIREVLDLLLNFSTTKMKIEQRPDRMRPSDVPVLLGDNQKFCKVSRWEPVIPFPKTLEDLLSFWRAQLRLTTFQSSANTTVSIL